MREYIPVIKTIVRTEDHCKLQWVETIIEGITVDRPIHCPSDSVEDKEKLVAQVSELVKRVWYLAHKYGYDQAGYEIRKILRIE